MHACCRLTLAPLFALAITFTGAAFAQTTAPAVPTMTPVPNCEKPSDPPSMSTGELGKSAAETKMNNWKKTMNTYLGCLRDFITEQQAASAPHVKAANIAVDEFNRSVKVFNDTINATKQ